MRVKNSLNEVLFSVNAINEVLLRWHDNMLQKTGPKSQCGCRSNILTTNHWLIYHFAREVIILELKTNVFLSLTYSVSRQYHEVFQVARLLLSTSLPVLHTSVPFGRVNLKIDLFSVIFTSPEWCPPPKISLQWFTIHAFLVSQNSGPFTRCLLRVVEWFYGFVLVFTIIFLHSLKKFSTFP